MQYEKDFEKLHFLDISIDSNDNELMLRKSNLRLCRIFTWSTYPGTGFRLSASSPPPHTVQLVESNSPAAATGLRIRDVILAVNGQNVSNIDYQDLINAIENIKKNNQPIELLVIEKSRYDNLIKKGIDFNPIHAKQLTAPTQMPREYMDFPKNTPRTCDVHLGPTDQGFGFDVIEGENDIGLYIQGVYANTPASRTALRKSDRILKIDDEFVDDKPSKMIKEKLRTAKKNGAVKLYVVDTHTYKYSDDAVGHSPLKSETWMRSSHQQDIRLCTITRADVKDTYGFEIVNNTKEKYCSIFLRPGRSGGPSRIRHTLFLIT